MTDELLPALPSPHSVRPNSGARLYTDDQLRDYAREAIRLAVNVDEAMLDRALEAYDDMYEAQYLTGGHTDNRVAAMHAALIAALPTAHPHEADQ